LCCRYGHVIHGLCATQSVYGNLNNLTVETDFVEAPVRTCQMNVNMTKSVLLSTVNIAVSIP
jgi:Zn-dependent oligopeptidase